MEKNRVEMIGTVCSQVWPVKTKSGVMAKLLLLVEKSRFWILGHGNVAQALLKLREGDELSVCGTGQINSWKTDDGHWKNDFQCVAWSVFIAGEEIVFEKVARKPQEAVNSKNSGQGTPACANDEYCSTAPTGEDVIF